MKRFSSNNLNMMKNELNKQILGGNVGVNAVLYKSVIIHHIDGHTESN